MPIFMIAAASLLAAPEPIPVRGGGDYPRDHLRAEHSAAAAMELFVGKDGRVKYCQLVAFDGNRELAEEICKIGERRIRYKPATDAEGRPAFAVVSSFVRMVVPDTPEGDRLAQAMRAPDLELTVQSLPPEFDGRLDLAVTLQIDPSGRPTECVFGPAAEHPAYARIACDHAMKQKFGVASEDGANPVPYVTLVSARFETPVAETAD